MTRINKILLILLFLSIIVIGCAKKPETGPETTCSSNNDCWCRSFTGANFIEGKTSPSVCCKEVNNLYCPSINHCARCLYK